MGFGTIILTILIIGKAKGLSDSKIASFGSSCRKAQFTSCSHLRQGSMFTSHFNKGLHTSINILFTVNSWDLNSDTGFSFGHYRIAEADDINACWVTKTVQLLVQPWFWCGLTWRSEVGIALCTWEGSLQLGKNASHFRFPHTFIHSQFYSQVPKLVFQLPVIIESHLAFSSTGWFAEAATSHLGS